MRAFAGLLADPDFRAAQVAEHADVLVQLLCGRAHPPQTREVFGEFAVREVDAKDADAFGYELLDDLWRAAGRAEGGYDFRESEFVGGAQCAMV